MSDSLDEYGLVLEGAKMRSTDLGNEVLGARSFWQVLAGRTQVQPDQIAYTFLSDRGTEAGHFTYAELDRRARAIAASLQGLGLGSDDRVLLLFSPGLGFIEAFFGCLYAGTVAVPAYPPRPGRPSPRLRAILNDAQPVAILTDLALLPKISGWCEDDLRGLRWMAVDSVPPEQAEEWRDPGADPDTIAFLQYTSGSTALPKGVMVSQGNLLDNQRLIREAFRQSESSLILGWLPVYHDMGLIGNVLQPLYVGARCVLMSPVSFLQSPVRWLRAISQYRATTSGGPNFAFDLCVRKIAPEERDHLDLSCWEVAFNGAEPVREGTLDRFVAAFAGCGFRREAFFPCYGLAEATLLVTGGRDKPAPVVAGFDTAALERGRASVVAEDNAAARRLVACGRLAGSPRIAVVDPERLTPCRSGEVGEIWVAGPSVARGYWGREEETRQTFGAFLGETGEGPFLRTGDLGFVADGELFITGRLKDLIIIRGRNYYPQDLELTAEQSHRDLRPGCSAAFSIDAEGEERLVLVLEADRRSSVRPEDIAEAVRDAVAGEHQIRVDEVALLPPGAIPKTTSGKIQRRACRDRLLAGELPVVGRTVLASEIGRDVPASVFTTEDLSAIEPRQRLPALAAYLSARAASVLRIDPSLVTPAQSLASLGLDSLTAAELKSRIEGDLGVSLALTDLLERSSPGELAAQLLAQISVERSTQEPSLRPLGRGDCEHPLSYGQRALWFLDRLDPMSSTYILTVAARIDGDIESRRLQSAFQALVDRHAVLRTVFTAVPGEEPMQRVLEAAEVDFVEEDCGAAAGAFFERRLLEEARLSFALEDRPALRIRLFSRQGERALLIAVHHAIADFWSLGLMVRELELLLAGGKIAPRPEPALRYTDYARFQRELLAGERGDRLWAYWRDHLAGELPDLDLPIDRPRTPVQSSAGANRCHFLRPQLAWALESLARSSGVTRYITLLSALEALLHRVCGQQDFVVGAPAAGRVRAELVDVFGYFVNPLPLRADVSGDPPFLQLLARVRRTVLGGLDHQELPLALLTERLRPNRDPSRSPIFQVLFTLHQPPPDLPTMAAFALGLPGARLDLGDLRLQSLALESGSAQFDLSLAIAILDGRLAASLQYRSGLFDSTTIERLLRQLEGLLTAAAADPGRRLSDLPFLSTEERHQVLIEWNQSAAESGAGLCAHDLFARQVRLSPMAPALACRGGELSYQDLDRRCDHLARELRSLGVGAEALVGVVMERSPEMVVSLLGILKAGGAYVPVDPAYPPQRVAEILQDAGVSLILAQDHLLERLPAAGARVLCLDSARLLAGACENAPLPHPDPENLAYVIYTSGSTGRPKGVAVRHSSVAALLWWAQEVFSTAELAAVLASTSICFDLSVFELLTPLSYGGKVVLVDDALELRALPASAGVTLVNAVPSAVAELVQLEALPASVRTVNLAGEALTAQLVAQLHASRPDLRVVNLYGPSEDTTYSTFAVIPQGSARPSIGRPITGTRAYVLDGAGEPVPIGVAGELHLGGAGLARGYLKRPEATAARFVPDRFSGEPGARLYRTGDLVRWLADGNLDFLGRLDHQVKVRGFRVELGEIEHALTEHPEVREAVAVLHRWASGDPGLVAYAVPGQTAPGEAALREFLAARLPRHMVPARCVLLPALPRTPSGKIDRRALPAPEPLAPTSGRSVPPRTPIEEILAGIWAELLDVADVSVHDSFFDLGGHSLKAARAVARAERVFGRKLSLVSLFRAPSVASFARMLEEGPECAPAPLIPTSREVAPPLSFAQQRLWFLDRLQPRSPAYNVPLVLRLAGRLSPTALDESLAEIVRRHETLRTTFPEVEGRPAQCILPPSWQGLPVVDLELAGAAADREALRILRVEGGRPFDLQRGSLLRALLLRLGPQEHLLLVVTHHIVFDGWSIGVLLLEIEAAYGGRVRGEFGGLPEPAVQYADFAAWQRRSATADLSPYWRSQLAGLPVLELPTDRPRPAMSRFAGGVCPVEVPRDALAALHDLARERGATLFMALLASFQALLSRYSGQDRVVVGAPVADRGEIELEGLIGLFINTLVLRGDLAGDPSFEDLLARLREAVLAAYEHRDVPFERLVEELAPERDLSRNPLFQVSFSLQEAPSAPRLPEVVSQLVEVHNGTAKLDLSLTFWERPEGLTGSFEYSTELFDAATIARLAGHFANLLAAVTADPRLRLSEIPLLTAGERSQVLVQWNDTRAEVERGCVHQLVALHARSRPDATAVVAESGVLTYGYLDRLANRLAHHLRARGVGLEAPVGVCLERSLEMVVALLGVLKAGGAYVPLDPTYPAERLAFMLRDAGCSVLLLQKKWLPGLTDGAAHSLCLDDPRELLAGEADETSTDLAGPGNLAYVIYTSGSTGLPKGVEVEHSGLANLVAWHRSAHRIHEEVRTTQIAGPGFDASAWEIWSALAAGASLHLAAERTRQSPSALIAWLASQAIEVSFLPTPLAEAVLAERWPARTTLRALLTGGDRLHHVPSTGPHRLFNHYGPTEGSVVTTWHGVDMGSRDSAPPIGRPITNVLVYVLDRGGRPAPAGILGELHIGGSGLARGYRGRPALTAERFVPHPYSDEPGARLYRSGDLVRWLADGTLDFVGRVDQQVKVRGFRIETGEIEAALTAHPAVREAVVAVREENREKRLVAYLVTDAGRPIGFDELRDDLKRRLPDYMVPSVGLFLPALPLTPNGKVDRAALPDPTSLNRVYTAPRNEAQRALAEIWREVLRVDRVGVDDNFFALGGHSLQMTRLVSRIRDEFGVELPLRTLFTAPTLAELAQVLVHCLVEQAADGDLEEVVAEMDRL